MMRITALGVLLSLVTSVALAGPAYTDPEKTDADFPYSGEYVGTVKLPEKPKTEENKDGEKKPEGQPAAEKPAVKEHKLGVQIIAKGKGLFRIIGYPGGLPGEGYDGQAEKEYADAALFPKDATSIKFRHKEIEGTVKDGKVHLVLNGEEIGVLEKIHRKSPTLGAKPPQDALVLFDGKNADAFENGKLSDDKLLMPGCTSKEKFGDHKVHIEFLIPYQPEEQSQARGNSGIYLQGRYEVQMLDSFGLAGNDNECGGIYSVAKPLVNMCFPPLSWQTYDIEYTAAKYEDGKLKDNPRITVLHNGVKIHDNVELPGHRRTTAAPNNPGPDDGPIYLQDHGNPVRYRNIWVVAAKKEAGK